MLTNLG